MSEMHEIKSEVVVESAKNTFTSRIDESESMVNGYGFFLDDSHCYCRLFIGSS